MKVSDLNTTVRKYWERRACGAEEVVVKDAAPMSREWFERVENYRYCKEPFIHSVTQFTRYRGKKILEVGVGAGTDHLQWARAGAECYGVDLTDEAIAETRSHLNLYGLKSNLQRIDAEQLPYPDNSFDVVYSWGVIHHSEHPELIIKEIYRVLKPGGQFIGMMYGRHSVVTLQLWLRHGLLKGRPFQSLAKIVWHHMESLGTKSYTRKELNKLFSSFSNSLIEPIITPYDRAGLPRFMTRWFPNDWGFFMAIRATK